MYLIAEQPYIKIEREVSSLEQRDIELNRTIYLYDEKVVTQHHEFPANEVFDMSYRFIGGEGGILYIHTSTGVFPYTVKSSPEAFVKAYKEHVKRW
ncbi:hypothetical protein KFZ58_18405 [Virgibacillus sp. NKC19-16]|uniref:hypothetical protein n=1 Tax=Virgibacillus salidurans TaxID=2831673 RepID=UPI001F2E4DA0|nr:hypothetical protein [Virgibacillus sp. NKC19-16]UJL46295.1 hypothetical protein KFZ58_18405 [Virgibacillus sp. NKC19-16]